MQIERTHLQGYSTEQDQQGGRLGLEQRGGNEEKTHRSEGTNSCRHCTAMRSSCLGCVCMCIAAMILWHDSSASAKRKSKME